MSVPDDYLKYPRRRYGMDHERYGWSILPRRAKVAWPNGARVALWVVAALEWFPLDMKGHPFKPPGALVTAYPDLRHYTLRDYGNRVGIFRVMNALDDRGMRASVAVNAAVAVRYPALVNECTARGWEIIGHGLDMDHLHHGGLALAEEKALVAKSLAALSEVSGQRVRGWLSPARSESRATLDLLAEAGIDYVCDWANDDMPYSMRAGGRTIHSMPHPAEIDDYAILVNNHHREDEFRDQLVDHFDALYEEAGSQGGRIMAISLHPWIIGQPYRIGALESALAHLMSRPGVWPATGAEILEAWRAQRTDQGASAA
ncbi:MAG TPA: polysaccharide deacetylase family protein [Burkholderiales bacterium]|nr:polysaccharide deacetylase family protein [Burkholderiales bacterium]